ncbi:MAG: hypothetical protein JWQ02_1316 [Capsulimonas sp.]|nr:hypothetical protein [Capsulimonas sp.]
MTVSCKVVASALSIAVLSVLSTTTHFARPAYAQFGAVDYISGTTSASRNSIGTFSAGSIPNQNIPYTWSCLGGTIISTGGANNSSMTWRAPNTVMTCRIFVRQTGVAPASVAVPVN